MSGIITSRRTASGFCDCATSMPRAPELAVSTSQSSVSSSVASATSRMSSSSSMISSRLCSTVHLRLGRHQVQEAHDLLFEFLERYAALDQKLGRPEAQARLFGGVELQRGVDDQRDVREAVALFQPVDDREAVQLREDEVEHDEIGTVRHHAIDRFASIHRMHRLDAVRFERRGHDAREVEIV